MKIIPKQGPTITPLTNAKSIDNSGQINPSAAPTPKTETARDRAIKAFTQAPAQAQETPVANPSNVSPEEMSAIKPPSEPITASTEASEPTQGQVDTVETKSEEAAKPEAPKSSEEKPLSSQYAQLARKEKAIRAKAQELKAKEESFRNQELALKAKEAELQSTVSLKDRLSKDPLTVLNELGVTYEQLTNLALSAPSPQDSAREAAFNKLQAEIKAIKDSQEADRKAYQDQQANSYKQAINQLKSEVTQLVKSDPNFETVKETNSIKDVVELIEETYKQNGILLSVEEATQAVEEHLIEEYSKIAKIGKIQKKLQPATKPAEPKKPQTVDQSSKQPQTMKTLTHAISTPAKLSARDRAILAFKGEKF